MMRFLDIAGYPHPTIKEPVSTTNVTPIIIASIVVVLIALTVTLIIVNKKKKGSFGLNQKLPFIKITE